MLRGGFLSIGGLSLGAAVGRTGTLTIEADSGDPVLGTTGAAVLVVGDRGDGELVQRAGSVGRLNDTHSHPNLNMGGEVGTVGRYTLDDGRLHVDYLQLGLYGRGEFVQNGGEVEIESLLHFAGLSGEGHYALNGGTLILPQCEIGLMGHGGTGQLDVNGGSLMLTGTDYRLGGLTVAQTAGRMCAIELRAKNLDTRTLVVGGGGHGILSLDDGSTLSASTEIVLGYDRGAEGEVTHSSGTVEAPRLFLGYGPSAIGLYEQTADSHRVTGDCYIGYGSTSTGDYTLGGGSEPGITHQIDGDLHLGFGNYSQGNYVIAGNVYHVGTGWTYAGELTVAGDVHVGGDGRGSMEIHPMGKLIAGGTVALGTATDRGEMLLDGGVVEGGGSLLVTSRGTCSGRGTVHLPTTNHGDVDLPDGHTLSFNDGFDQSAAGQTSIGSGASLTLRGGGTIEGTIINRGHLETGGGVFHLDAPLNGGDDPDGELVVSGGELHSGERVEASGIVVRGTLYSAADVESTITEVQETGHIEQTTGRVDAGDLTIRQGSYRLAGPGNLLSVEAKVYGEFNHESADHTANTLRIGGDLWGYILPGSYTISGGRLHAGSVQVGDLDVDGTLAVTDAAAEVLIKEELVLSQSARIAAVPGTTIRMTGAAFDVQGVVAANVADLRNIEFLFDGGAAEPSPLEVAGEDRRQLPCGLSNNFALDRLTLGDAEAGYVSLADVRDNQPGSSSSEALYVHTLTVGPGSTLDLAGLRLYYCHATIDPTATIEGGSVVEVYMSSTFAVVEGAPSGHPVVPLIDEGGTGGMGVHGVAGAGEARLLSAVAELMEEEVDQAIVALAAAGMSDPYVTLKLFYDETELDILGIAEETLRPYWWDDAAGDWVLGGTTPSGAIGESLFAGINVDDDRLGYCGLNTIENYLWANINHASVYTGAGTTIPEPSAVALFVTPVICLFIMRRRRRWSSPH